MTIDCDAVCLQLQYRFPHLVDGRGTQAGGGLVHDHETGIECGRAGDRHGLLLPTRDRTHRRTHARDPESETLDQSLRALVHVALVEEATAPTGLPQFTAKEDVLRHVQLGHQREVLVHHLDPDVACVHRTREVHRVAIQEDLPSVGHVDTREDLHQRGLACGVVADQADDLGGVDVNDTCRSATTAPKVLLISRISMSGVDIATTAPALVRRRGWRSPIGSPFG